MPARPAAAGSLQAVTASTSVSPESWLQREHTPDGPYRRGGSRIGAHLRDGTGKSNSAANASVIADFGDAHPPRGIGGGDLGYIADYVLEDRYIALVVDYGLRPVQDRWSIAVVDVAEGKSAVLPLLPRDFAGTWAVEGLGLSLQ